MAGSRPMRLVQAALRCYPQRWRSRHGQEAAELARLLMRDGTPARSIAWSYAKGAAAARLAPQPRGRLGAAAGALLAAACALGISLALLPPSAPASAASVVRLRITNREDAAGQLQSLLRAHHFDITVTQEPVSPSLAGSIVSSRGQGPSPGGDSVSDITGPCSGGAWGCTDGIALPAHFTGAGRIVVGRPAIPGERYAAAADIFRPGELLHCTGLLGESVRRALGALRSLHVTIAWDTGDRQADRRAIPDGHYYVAGGTARSSASVSIRVTVKRPPGSNSAGSDGQHC